MNKNIGKLIIGALLVLLVAGIASQLEKVEKTVNEGPGLSVRNNSFYAAGKFLESKGIKVKHSTAPISLIELAENETLLLTNSQIFDDDSDINKLVEWIAAGGNLIFQHNGDENYNPVAAHFDISIDQEPQSQEYKDLRQTYYDQLEERRSQLPNDNLSPKQQVRADIQLTETSLPSALVSHYKPLNSESDVSLFIQSSLGLSQPFLRSGQQEINSEQIKLLSIGGNKYAENIATFRYGRGYFTVITDATIWNNYQIGRYDHAHLLALLTHNSTQISIQRFVNWPSLDTLIIKYAPELLLSCGLMLLAWLISKSQRFGPSKTTSELHRRSLREHIKATANFHYRQGHHNYLLAPLRRQIHKKMQQRYGNFSQLSELQQFSLIADASGIDENNIIFAMREADSYRDNQLFELIQLLTKIRNTL